MANIWEKDILILAGKLNSGHSYPTTTVNSFYFSKLSNSQNLGSSGKYNRRFETP